MLLVLTELVNAFVPIYSLVVIVIIAAFHLTPQTKQGEKSYNLVKKAKEVDPNDWKKAFAGNWTLQRRERLRDVSRLHVYYKPC